MQCFQTLTCIFPANLHLHLPKCSNPPNVISNICHRMPPAISPSRQPRDAIRIFAHTCLHPLPVQGAGLRTGCVPCDFDSRAKQSSTPPISLRPKADDSVWILFVCRITGLGFISYSFFGMLRQASFARHSLMGFVVLGICELSWGIGLNAGLSSFAPVLGIYLTSNLIFFLAILVERYFIYLCFLAGLVSLVIKALRHTPSMSPLLSFILTSGSIGIEVSPLLLQDNKRARAHKHKHKHTNTLKAS